MRNLLLLTFFFVSTLSSYGQKELWGMTSEGGLNNAGVIFKTDGSGNNFSLEHTMFRYDGDYPKADLTKTSDGKFYGVTSACCVFDGESILFQYDPVTSTYTKKYTFHDLLGGTKCYGSLLEASDGKLYGLTSLGGVNNKGTIFQFDPLTSTYTKKFDFDSINGTDPEASLIKTPDGKLYGMTLKGGANNFGVIFEYDPLTNIVSKKFDFDGTAHGSGPEGSLLFVNGTLFGLTNTGGVNDLGVIFKYNPSNSTYTKLFDFDGLGNGSGPSGSLAIAPDGSLYGMTIYGGTMDMGVLFQFDPSTSSCNKKHDFGSVNDGSYPWGSLLLAADGNFYGMTNNGGADDVGTIFEYNLSTSGYSKKFDFDLTTGGNPSGSLVADQDGTLYGMTNRGGIVNVGVLFQFDPSNSHYSNKLDFHFSPSGSFPVGALMQAANGMLYGTTRNGGTTEEGVIFQYDKNTGTYTKKLEFNNTISGRYPSGSLVQTADGKLYGMTTQGGSMDMGVLFQYDPAANVFNKMFDFDGINKGSNPWGALLKGTDGKLYGMTQNGGVNDLGVIFSYDPSKDAYTDMFDFDGAKGKVPEGSLVQGKDGALYGMTNQGGANDYGVLFKYDLSASTYTDKFDFDDSINGSFPTGSLIRGADDNLYGMANQGGANELGVLFQYNTSTSQYIKKFDFNGFNGSLPNGSLVQASDGNLYGMTPEGGKNGSGVLFQFDLSSSSCVTKFDFDVKNGSDPSMINLIELASTNSISELGSLVKEIYITPNPSTGKITVELNQKVIDASLKLFTVTGQMVFSKESFSGDKLSMDISEQAKGVYFMEVTENGNMYRAKIVKN